MSACQVVSSASENRGLGGCNTEHVQVVGCRLYEHITPPFCCGSKKMQLSLTSSFRFYSLQWPKILHFSGFFLPGVKTSICVWRMWRSWPHKWPQLSKSKNKTSVMIHNSSLPFAFCAWGDAWQNSEAWPRFRGGEACCDILAHSFSTPFFKWCIKWSRMWGPSDLKGVTREYFHWKSGRHPAEEAHFSNL